MATAVKTAPSAEEATAAGLRALRAAVGNLASQFGYRRDTLNEVLLALGADRQDLEVMRQFLVAHPAPEGGETP